MLYFIERIQFAIVRITFCLTFLNWCFCSETEDLEQCLDESSSSCPSVLVSTWKAALAYIKTGCEYAGSSFMLNKPQYNSIRFIINVENAVTFSVQRLYYTEYTTISNFNMYLFITIISSE